MDYFPLFLHLSQHPCLVVGGGETAARKISLLHRAGAQITIVAPTISTSVQQLLNTQNIRWRQQLFNTTDVIGFNLVIAATNDTYVNQQISQAAKAQGILVNVVDNPKLCSFIFPAIIDRSPLVIAIGSNGSAPVLTRLLRARLESLIPHTYGKLAQLAADFRAQVKTKLPDTHQRRRFWERTLQGPIAELVFAGQSEQAQQALQQALEQITPETPAIGEVYLIGAGPGDPDLLTFRALRLMQQADVIVYDRLVSPAVLDLARRDATKLYVGKQRAQHSMPQTDINQLLADLAKQGKRVARLKGGDPFIFGRGGEEIATLMAEGIQFQVVPGITAASGCATYAGIPLTHRDYAQAVTFVTGHVKAGTLELNWAQLAAPNQTVVIYMGLVGLPTVCHQLIAHGAASDLPVALIEQGTLPQQRIFVGTLTTLPTVIAEQAIQAPTLIIVGNVVRLHPQLHWFNGDNVIS